VLIFKREEELGGTGYIKLAPAQGEPRAREGRNLLGMREKVSASPSTRTGNVSGRKMAKRREQRSRVDDAEDELIQNSLTRQRCHSRKSIGLRSPSVGTTPKPRREEPEVTIRLKREGRRF